eukprot:ctg_2510.g347
MRTWTRASVVARPANVPTSACWCSVLSGSLALGAGVTAVAPDKPLFVGDVAALPTLHTDSVNDRRDAAVTVCWTDAGDSVGTALPICCSRWKTEMTASASPSKGPGKRPDPWSSLEDVASAPFCSSCGCVIGISGEATATFLSWTTPSQICHMRSEHDRVGRLADAHVERQPALRQAAAGLLAAGTGVSAVRLHRVGHTAAHRTGSHRDRRRGVCAGRAIRCATLVRHARRRPNGRPGGRRQLVCGGLGAQRRLRHGAVCDYHRSARLLLLRLRQCARPRPTLVVLGVFRVHRARRAHQRPAGRLFAGRHRQPVPARGRPVARSGPARDAVGERDRHRFGHRPAVVRAHRAAVRGAVRARFFRVSQPGAPHHRGECAWRSVVLLRGVSGGGLLSVERLAAGAGAAGGISVARAVAVEATTAPGTARTVSDGVVRVGAAVLLRHSHQTVQLHPAGRSRGGAANRNVCGAPVCRPSPDIAPAAAHLAGVGRVAGHGRRGGILWPGGALGAHQQWRRRRPVDYRLLLAADTRTAFGRARRPAVAVGRGVSVADGEQRRGVSLGGRAMRRRLYGVPGVVPDALPVGVGRGASATAAHAGRARVRRTDARPADRHPARLHVGVRVVRWCGRGPAVGGMVQPLQSVALCRARRGDAGGDCRRGRGARWCRPGDSPA